MSQLKLRRIGLTLFTVFTVFLIRDVIPQSKSIEFVKLDPGNPLLLVIRVSPQNRITLNNDEVDITTLAARLNEVFHARKRNGVYREGTNQVETTVWFISPKSISDLTLSNRLAAKALIEIRHTDAAPIKTLSEREYNKIIGEQDQNEKRNYLLFSSDANRNQEIYSLDELGIRHDLTNNPADDGYPRCSPDGRKISFASNRGGSWSVYVMDADGSNPRKLTTGLFESGYADWSPDGQTLVFAGKRNSRENNDIYLIRANGTGLRQLTKSPAEDVHPAWSPDGKRIVFASEQNGNRQLYVIDTGGTNVTRLMSNRWYDDYPSWSPDGSTIAFASDRDSRNSEKRDIYTIDTDNFSVKRVTSHASDDRHPTWALDGKVITFASDRNGTRNIFSVRLNTLDVSLVYADNGNDEHPAWSAFRVPITNQHQLFVVKGFGKLGYIDASGEIVIAPQFDEALPFENGVAVVRKRTKYFLINPEGRYLIELPYAKVFRFSEGLAQVQIRGLRGNVKNGFIDTSGGLIIPARYDDAYWFSEGLAPVKLGNLWGFIDNTGSLRIRQQYVSADPFSDGSARVRLQSNDLAFIENSGRTVFNLGQRWDLVGCWFNEGLVVYWPQNQDGSPGLLGYLDRYGRPAIRPQFQNAGSFSEGVALAQVGFHWGYIDSKGKLVIRPQFFLAGDFSEGLAPAMHAFGKHGYIDKSGKMVISPQFDNAGPFVGGLAPVNSIEKTWGYFNSPMIFDGMAINKRGEIVWRSHATVPPSK